MIVIVCSLLCVFSIKPVMQSISYGFWNFIAENLDREEQERNRKAANGEIIRGKDTVLIWGEMYEIGHYSDGDHLSIKNKDASLTNILKKIKKHKVSHEALYIVSEEGFGIIDKNNFCRVYITVPKEEFVSGYYIDAEGNQENISRYVENIHIQYLADFNEFSIEEQEELKELNT